MDKLRRVLNGQEDGGEDGLVMSVGIKLNLIKNFLYQHLKNYKIINSYNQ